MDRPGGAQEERLGILVLVALGHGLVVDDLWERQAGGDEGEGGFGVGVLGGVQAGEAEIEVGFEGLAVVGRDLGQRGGGFIVVAVEVVLLAQGEQSGGVVGGVEDSDLQVLDALGAEVVASVPRM